MELERQVPGCPYCGNPALLLRSSAPLYGGRDFGPVWACTPCAAWVGCHPGTTKPLGRLANAQLRRAKMRAHAEFDRLWKDRHMSRTEAYAALSKAAGLPPGDCHIGMFDVETCDRVAAWATRTMVQLRRRAALLEHGGRT